MKLKIHFVTLLFVISTLYSFSQNEVVNIPKGKAVNIDGNINLSEWENALKLPLYGGEHVYFQTHKDTLFIAVKGKSGGFCSLALGNNNEFRILHSSTGLITAKYQKVNDNWQLVHDFKRPLNKEGEFYTRGAVRQKPAYMKSKLEQFGWYSNLVEMGAPSETEYAIPLPELRTDRLYLSIVFFQIKAAEKYAKLPAGLSDDCLNSELVSGSAKQGLSFNPENWIQLINLK